MNPLLERFVAESRELLETAAAGLLRLEKAPGEAGTINDLFRAVHTIKGSSGLFDIPAFTGLVHAAEDLLQSVRAGGTAFTPALADLLLRAFDQVAAWLDELERGEELPPEAAALSQALVQEIRGSFGAPRGADPAPGPASGPTPGPTPGEAAAAPPAVALPFAPAVLERAQAQAAAAGNPLIAVAYRPDEGCFFRGEDPLHLCRQTPALVALHVAPRAPWPPLAALDPFQCRLAFTLLTAAPRAEVAHHFRYVPDEVTIAELPAAAASPDARRPSPAALPEGEEISELLAAQLRLLRAPAATPAARRGAVTAAATTVRRVLRAAGGTDGPPASALQRALDAGEGKDLALWLEAALGGAAGAPLPSPPAQGEAAAAPAGEVAERGEGDKRAGGASPSRVLKVSQEKIDQLMSLVGEFIVAKNSLPFLAKRAEEVYGARRLAQEIKAQYHVVDRLAQEMQNAVMQVRLLPVAEAFQRFPRLVRDAGRKLGKEIDLVVEGEDTEADKNIIELLGDPLIHIVRNAVDHGLETPEERRRAGKPEVGTLRLAAAQEGDAITVAVADDGRGIDPDRVRAKAVEKGMLDPAAAAAMPDEEAIRLVFAPGFSTAAVVSDLSGRGVGMDVVMTTLQRAGGSVRLRSRVGEGTTVMLRVPLSMTVTRVMIVEVGENRFGLPMDDVVQTVRVAREAIRTVKHRRVFTLRERIVPLHRLRDLLALPDDGAAEGDSAAVMVVKLGAELVGLEVERFREGTDVIVKPLDGILAGMRGFTGTALLGDGQVLLILNPRELV